MFNSSYYKINEKSGISPFQNTCAYLGGSMIQTVADNPVTAYRQLVQQYAKNSLGETVSPKEAVKEANKVFMKSPLNSSLSGLTPRLIGVLLKRIPKFGMAGIFRGQGVGIFKAIISLSLFHEGRLFLTEKFKKYNVN